MTSRNVFCIGEILVSYPGYVVYIIYGITKPLTTSILKQEKTCQDNVNMVQTVIKRWVKIDKRKAQAEDAGRLRDDLSSGIKRAMDLDSEKGASSWFVMTLPISEHGFALPKGSFRDALCLRYGWKPSNLPSQCICGTSFSSEHALSCPHGGFPSIRHDDIRDLTAKLLTEVCSNVAVEPTLITTAYR